MLLESSGSDRAREMADLDPMTHEELLRNLVIYTKVGHNLLRLRPPGGSAQRVHAADPSTRVADSENAPKG